jgi:hypothetical protein
MKDREFHSHDDIEEAITVAWNDLTFEDVQSIFYDWMGRSDGGPGTFCTPCMPFDVAV